MMDKAHATDAKAAAPADDDETPGAPAAPTPPAPRRGPGHRGQDVRDTVAEMAARAQEISQEAGSKMASALKDVISAAAGLSAFAVESARDLVQYMVRRGQMTQEEADKLIREAEAAHIKRGGTVPPPAAAESGGGAAKKAAAPATVPVSVSHAPPHAIPAAAAHHPPPPPPAAKASAPAAKKSAPAAKTSAKAPARPSAAASKSSSKSSGKAAAKKSPPKKR